MTSKLAATRDGFTLIEVLVAIVLLAIVLTMLASFSTGTAMQLVRMSQHDVRQAVTLREINRLATMPYDALPGIGGCRNVKVANLEHTSCVTVTTAGRTRTVQVIVTPLRAGTYADTMVLQRVAVANNPLNTP